MSRNSRNDPVSATGSMEIAMGNGAVELEPPIRSIDPCLATLQFDSRQKCIHAAAHDPFDGAEPAIGRILVELHLQAIAVHDAAHLTRRDEDALLHPIDAKEPVTRTIGADHAFDHATPACGAGSAVRSLDVRSFLG